MTDRRSFVAWLGSLTTALRWPRAASPTPVLRAVPTALYRQPDGRSNLVRVTVTGLDAPAARARLTDRRGALVGTAGLLPDEGGTGLAGEVWVPLAEPVLYQIDLEVGKQRVVRQRVRLVPPRRWTLYWIASSHTDLGLTDLRERCVEAHRRNLDAALARLPTHPDFRWTAECALPAVSYVENREPAAGDALVRAIRDGKIGFTALFANLLTGLLDHETLARAAWPAGLFAREHGLGYAAALMADVPGQTLTFPTLLAASGVRYLASGVNPERAVPLLSSAAAAEESSGTARSGFTPLARYRTPLAASSVGNVSVCPGTSAMSAAAYPSPCSRANKPAGQAARARVSWSSSPVRRFANSAVNPILPSRMARTSASPAAGSRFSTYETAGSAHSAVHRKSGWVGRRARAASRLRRCASTQRSRRSVSPRSVWLEAIQYSVHRRGGTSRTRWRTTRCLPTSRSIWYSTGSARGTHTSPASPVPPSSGKSPAVPTSAPRRSVRRARAAGASSPVTVTRTRLLRPSGCRYRAVGTARRTGVGEAARGHRSAVVRLPSQATKLRRSVMCGHCWASIPRAVPRP